MTFPSFIQSVFLVGVAAVSSVNGLGLNDPSLQHQGVVGATDGVEMSESRRSLLGWKKKWGKKKMMVVKPDKTVIFVPIASASADAQASALSAAGAAIADAKAKAAAQANGLFGVALADATADAFALNVGPGVAVACPR